MYNVMYMYIIYYLIILSLSYIIIYVTYKYICCLRVFTANQIANYDFLKTVFVVTKSNTLTVLVVLSEIIGICLTLYSPSFYHIETSRLIMKDLNIFLKF